MTTAQALCFAAMLRIADALVDFAELHNLHSDHRETQDREDGQAQLAEARVLGVRNVVRRPGAGEAEGVGRGTVVAAASALDGLVLSMPWR